MPIPEAAEGAVELRVLGQVELCPVTDGPVRLSGLERGLLSLAAFGGGLTTTSLSEWLWGDAPPPSARNRVQALVSGIRRKAGGAGSTVLLTDGSGYRLDARLRVDLTTWEQLVCRARTARAQGPQESLHLYEQALDLFGDKPLQGAPETPAVQLERDRLSHARLTVLEERIDTALVVGRLDGLVAELAALTNRHPYNETFLAQFVLALAACGQQAKALEVYRTAYHRLDDELGVEPSPRLQEAHRRVLSGEVPQPAPVSTGSAAGEPKPQPAASELKTPETPAKPQPAPSDPSPTPARDIVGTVAESLPSPVPSVGQALPTPRTLPRRPHGFLGREPELETISAAGACSTEAAATVLVTGLAGVGKSALVVEAGARVRDTFPGGTLYVDVSSEQSTGEADSVIAVFLHLLGVMPEAIPETPAARAGLYRSLIDGRRLLVVLDNVDHRADQIDQSLLDLLPTSAGSMALVTARTPPSRLQPTHHLRLRPLPTQDAVRLLAGVAGAERVEADPAAAEELASHTGCLPLALRLVGGRLAQRPDLSVRRMARRLQDIARGLDDIETGGPENASVRASLTMVWDRLPERTRQTAALLAVLPLQTFSPWVPQALLDDQVAGERAMDALIDASFVEPVIVPGHEAQYRLHNLVARFAREHAPVSEAEAEAAVLSVSASLLVLVEGYRHAFPLQFLPAAPPPRDARQDERRVTIEVETGLDSDEAREACMTALEAVRSCARAVAHHRPQLAWRLLAAAGNAHHVSPEHLSWLAACESVTAELAQDCEDQRLGRAVLSVARAWHQHDHLGRSTPALTLASQARRDLTLLGAATQAAAAGLVASHAALALGRRDTAEAELARAADLLSRHPDRSLEGWTHIVRGELHNDYDELVQSRHEFTTARSLLDDSADRLAHALATVYLSRTCRRLGELEIAQQLVRESLVVLQRFGAEHLFTVALDASAEVEAALGDGAAALDHATVAHQRAVAAQDAFLTARTSRTRGRALLALGRLAEAADEFRRSVDAFAVLGRDLSVAGTLRDLAHVQRLQGQAAAAKESTRREQAALARAGVVPDEVDLAEHQPAGGLLR
ncbi:BTAD domain-containing putative transcriptional regulator [Knoellia sp. p5-6-4]|uniref:AfsR/SARP family transcriptional regulator n=1 Tax=unclassified Knoellia TaxID=2618719 RepID=UPI0023DB1C42|nr:BTAD domain-containing putative transcriptional regulator [Knoellia sp. p5-6-4]MDF2146435.1 BTAD domain-containing putative transcriptional regulator [Knoellia sp. p5-6-4]